MDNDLEKFIRDLHKENSLFLNKALFGVPTVGVPILVGILNNPESNAFKWPVFLACISLAVSVLLLLHSFFLTESAIEAWENKRESESKILNQKVKGRNRIAYYAIVLGFVLTLISVMPLEKYNNATSKKGEVSMSKEEKGNATNTSQIAKKGLTIPQSAYTQGSKPVQQQGNSGSSKAGEKKKD